MVTQNNSSNNTHYDLCVIGGGINGAGIARDAAGRGLSVLLVEAQDLAGATSSASTKLIHGGLRYLEHYEFGLVRKALKEREVLMNMAPHIIWPLTFVLPHNKNLRPQWLIRCGLFLYDFLAGRGKLQRSRKIDLLKDKLGQALQNHYETGFSYADCWVEDSRLVVLNAMDAAEHGANILTRTACTGLKPDQSSDYWHITLQNMHGGAAFTRTADNVVNAGGPWVRGILEQSGLDRSDTPHIRLVKGSHIIVRQRYKGDHCYILQQDDGRIVFTIPYEKDYTLIGTTDEDFQGDPVSAEISEAETAYLLNAANRSLKIPTKKADIVASYSGVRPLFDDGDASASEVTRDYRLILDTSHGAPLLSVFGGKLTTYRTLSEQAVNMLCQRGFWTKGAVLPGGDIRDGDFDQFVKNQKTRYSGFPAALIHRYARAYGTRMDIILKSAKKPSDLGEHFGDGLYQAEVDYLIEHEWAMTAQDILWRRSKLALHVKNKTVINLEDYIKGRKKT